MSYLESLDFGTLKVLAKDRKELVGLIKEAEPEISNRKIARSIGTDEKTIRKDIGADKSAESDLVPEGEGHTNADKSAPVAVQEKKPDIVQSRRRLPEMDLETSFAVLNLKDIARNATFKMLTLDPRLVT
jgi:hypothetical protein